MSEVIEITDPAAPSTTIEVSTLEVSETPTTTNQVTDLETGIVELTDTDTAVVTEFDTQVIEVDNDGGVEVDVSSLGERGDRGVPGPEGPTGPRGDPGPQGVAGTGAAYVHYQNIASAAWTIVHDLGFFPNVTIEDSAGSEVEGEIEYVNANSITITFTAAFGGVAYLS